MNNMEYASRILNAYEQFITMKLKQCEDAINNPNIKKAAKRHISNDFLLKVSYALSMAGKFFLITCLGVDGAMVSFDTYKYNKEKSNFRNKYSGNNYSGLFREYISKMKSYIEIYNSISLLIEEIRKYIQNFGSEKFVKTFSSYANENNKFWSLFKTCTDLGIEVGSYKNIFDNTSIKNSKLSVDINNIMSEYFGKKQVGNNKKRR